MNFATSCVELLRDSSDGSDNADNVLCCEHGPALLFRRLGTDSKNCARPFYACSACRQRKDCSFFVWKDEASRCGFKWDAVKRRILPTWTHEQLHARFLKLLKCESSERYLCCRTLLSKKEMKNHFQHPFRNPLTDDELRRPSRLLLADVNSATKAQFFFDDSCVSFVVDTLSRLGFDRVLCVGTPSLHEYIREHRPSMDSLLLDIEQSYEQFYGPDEFCWFNMFNNFHFRGAESETALRNSMASGTRCALLVDPPFGGLVDAVARTLERIVEEATAQGCELNVFWFFPYFNEKRIVAAMPRLRMLDYAVHYENHTAFSGSSEKRAKGSPVRIFTDVPLGQIPLPEEDYAFCAQCDRWVARHNRHCAVCNDCPSKDGGPYRHCDRCGVCVKEANEHCPTCERCLPRGHDCQSKGLTCFLCRQPGHKSTECVQKVKKGHRNLKRTFIRNQETVAKGKKRKR